LLWLIAHTELFFPISLVCVMLAVELGLRLRQASLDIDPERESLVESARDGLLLGFSLPMVLPHYEQGNRLVLQLSMT
jgi:hypothetical protein